jgi:hypothetical protein
MLEDPTKMNIVQPDIDLHHKEKEVKKDSFFSACKKTKDNNLKSSLEVFG